MGMYGFKRRFVAPIQSGVKRHTIRANRKYPDKPGSIVHAYYAPRTKQCFLIGRFLCTRVLPITIWEISRTWAYVGEGDHRIVSVAAIKIDGIELSQDEKEQLAICDGFNNLTDMISFWDLSKPFHGHIIHWQYPGMTDGQTVVGAE